MRRVLARVSAPPRSWTGLSGTVVLRLPRCGALLRRRNRRTRTNANGLLTARRTHLGAHPVLETAANAVTDCHELKRGSAAGTRTFERESAARVRRTALLAVANFEALVGPGPRPSVARAGRTCARAEQVEVRTAARRTRATAGRRLRGRCRREAQPEECQETKPESRAHDSNPSGWSQARERGRARKTRKRIRPSLPRLRERLSARRLPPPLPRVQGHARSTPDNTWPRLHRRSSCSRSQGIRSSLSSRRLRCFQVATRANSHPRE